MNFTQGGPGSGKTKTLAAAALMTALSGYKVLVVAPSKGTVDEICKHLDGELDLEGNPIRAVRDTVRTIELEDPEYTERVEFENFKNGVRIPPVGWKLFVASTASTTATRLFQRCR